MERCFDAQKIMTMVDHPDVKQWLPPLTLEKMTEYLADPRTIAITGDGAGAVFEWSAPSIYECHLFFQPSCRGRKAIASGRKLADIMINEYGACMLWGEIRIENKHTRWFSRQVGFRSLGIELRPDGPREIFVKEREA